MANEFKVKNGIKFPDDSVQTTAFSSIKTLNSISLLGSGNIALFSGGLTDVQVVSSLPGSPNASTLYIVTG
jgi:hypothetical protein